MDNDFKYLLDAGLDDNAKQHLQNDLNNIKDLAATISKLNLSNDAVAELKQSLQKNGIDLDVLININQNQVRQAQQAGQQIGQQIQRGIQDAIQKGDFQTKFEFKGTSLQNNVAKDAKEYFEGLKKGAVSVKEEMRDFNGTALLNGFTVSIKKANGVIEELKYSLEDLEGQTGKSFQYIGGSINDNGVVKQINAITDTISSYKQKIAQFKSTNESILSGIDFTNFNNAMTALENGTGSINAVKNAYKDLGMQASNITKELSGQLSKAGSAVRNIAKGDETIAGLKAELSGLNNVPKEITTQLNGLGVKLAEIRRIESENGRNTDWSKAYREWQDEIDVLTAKLRVLQKEQKNASSEQIFKLSDLKASETPYMSKVENTIEAQMKYVKAMAKNNGWTNVDVSGIERADGMIKKLTITYTDAEGAVKRFNMERRKMQGTGRVNSGLMQVGDVQVIKTATKAEQELANAMADGREKAEQERIAIEQKNQAILQQKSDNILSKASVGDYDVAIQKQIADLQKYGYTAEQAESQVFGLTNALKTMSSVDATHEERIAAEEKWQKEMAKTTNTVSEAKLEWQGLVSVQQRLSKANQIESFLQKNTRITKEAKAELERYVVSLRDVDTAMSKVAKNNIDIKFQEIQNSMRGLNRLGYALSDQLKQAASSFTQWISVSSLIMTGVYKTRQSVAELVEVDNILTEVSKTSDMTKQELMDLGKTSFNTASQLGRTATDYLNTVTEMSRSGFYGEQGEAMARQTLLAQTAGDLTNELASKYILATNAAYKLNGEASKLNEILDGQNMITNRNSVSMTDMAEAMSEAGSVASTYRVDADQFSAMVGTIEAVTKLGGNEIGTGIKSLLINLQNVNSSKITGTLSRAGADMTEFVNGVEKLREPMDILRDLSETFRTLDEDNPLRAEILTNIGGKYQATKLAALLDNFDMYDKMLQDYSEGFGSAAQEADKSANNISGSLNKLHNNWVSIINSMINSDTMLFGVNTLNDFLSLINETTDALGSFGTLGMIGTGIASAKGYGLNVIVYKPLFIRSYNNAI